MICLLLVLSACGVEKTLILNKNMDTENVSSDVLNAANEHVLTNEGLYYLGSGISVPEVTAEGTLTDNNSNLYPLYMDDELISYIKENADGTVSFMDNAEEINLNDNSFVIECEGNTYVIDEGGDMVIAGDKTKKLDKKIIEKLVKDTKSDAKPGLNKRLVKWDNVVIDSKTGIRYSSNRLVVVFEEGDKDKMVSDFAEFCNGKLKASIKSIGQYTFEVEPSSYLKLSKLAEKAMQLDYVKSAHLDEQKDQNSSSSSNVKNLDK